MELRRLEGHPEASSRDLPTIQTIRLRFAIAAATVPETQKLLEDWLETIATGNERSSNGVPIMQAVRRQGISGNYAGIDIRQGFAGATLEQANISIDANQDGGAIGYLIMDYSFYDRG